MSPIDTSGLKASAGVDPARQDVRTRDGESEASAKATPKPADSVQLTETAARLAELQSAVAAADGVDLEKVEEIRKQIADGSYQVDKD